MSDETIQYITTDYLIEVDSGEPAPAPIEYIVELGQVGVQGIPGEKGEPGFSPTVGYILSDDTFRINITNQDGVIQTPNLYDYFADKNGYLKVDGSNADSDIVINSIQLSNSMGTSIISTSSRLNLVSGTDSNIHLFPGGEGKVYYGGNSYANKEIATIGDIGNGTITLTQGGATKGTFTTNQSGNTTINLDAGGGSITNPLEIEDTNSNNFISIGVDNSGANIRLGNTQGLSFNSYLIGNATAPLELTNGAFGDKIIKLNIDSNTLAINSDNKLTVIGGGGGTTYTEGTGIDITSNVISIDTDVVAQLSDIPDTSDMATQTWVGNQGYLTSITSGDVTSALGYTPLQSSDLSNYVDLTSNQTITGKKAFSGAELETNNVITLKGNAIIRGLYNTNSYSTYLVGSRGSLLVGNESHGITLRGNAARPVYRTGGTDYNIALSGDIPSLATTSTAGIVQPDGNTITVNNGVVSATPARNIGEIVHSLVPLTDAGLHLLDGSLISGSGSYADFVTYISGLVSTYPDLFETEANWQTSVTTYGVCGKFVYDSVNNTVRLPKITGIIEGTIDATALGDLVQAGLPNITGFTDFWSFGNGGNNPTGAFYIGMTGTGSPTGGSGIAQLLSFDASRSNPIYGNSTTVQPQTIKAFIYIVIATSVKTDIQVDIDEIATDLNGKAGTDLANLNNTGKIAIAHNAMPSNTYDNLTLGASGTSYTAPADGWYLIDKRSNAAGQWVYLTNTSSGDIKDGYDTAYSGYECIATLAVKKGDIVNCDYIAGGDLIMFRFYYAVGSKSEAQ